jgi:hypothetical protein
MSTTTTPPNPTRDSAASEPDDGLGPITELGPLEPQTPAQRIQTIADFQPTERLAEQILTDASNPRVPLHTIAEKARTTIEALQAWLARPEVAERLDTIIASIRQRSRLKLTYELDNITEACATILKRFHRAPDRGSTEDRRPDTELRASSIITRNASNALMASRVMLALAHYLERPPRSHRRASAPSDPLPTPNPNPDRPSASTSPLPLRTSPLPTFRLLPALPSLDLHDFREYLTSNHHHNGHTVEELTVPRDVAVPPQQPVQTTSIATTSTQPPTTHHQSYPSSQSSPSYSGPTRPCGPTPCTTCPIAPRSRDPTAPRALTPHPNSQIELPGSAPAPRKAINPIKQP